MSQATVPNPWARQHIREYHAADIGPWATAAKRRAFTGPVYDGDIEHNKWMVFNARYFLHPLRAMVILTRDNLVKLGFWKNADYENCLHLSISFKDPVTAKQGPWDELAAETIIEAAFGPLKRMLWYEPPYSEKGKLNDVHHWRLFYAPDWCTPIMPRGEPHTLAMPAGWRGWTECQAAQPTPNFNADITEELPLRRTGV